MLIKIIIQENIMKEAEINLVNKIQDIKKILIIKLIIIRNKDKNNKSHKRSNLKNRITLMICQKLIVVKMKKNDEKNNLNFKNIKLINKK